MKLIESPLCSQCRTVDVTFFHLFSVCPVTLHSDLGGTEKVVKPRDMVASFDSRERHPR